MKAQANFRLSEVAISQLSDLEAHYKATKTFAVHKAINLLWTITIHHKATSITSHTPTGDHSWP